MTKEANAPSALGSAWLEAGGHLGIEVAAPFSPVLPDGTQVNADALVRNFGAPNGMLLFSRYDDVKHLNQALQNAGFGFSVLDPPDTGRAIDPASFADVLRDWGWSGPPDKEPIWLRSGR